MADTILYQQRTVTIHKDSGFDSYMSDHHGHTAMQAAIGYLSEWNMWANRFDTVTISCTIRRGLDEQPEIGATYRSADGSVGYFICAIFHPQTSPTDENPNGTLARFSFHS